MANFIRHTECPKCGSSDGNALYDDDSTYCFVCNYTVASPDQETQRKPSSNVKVSSFLKAENNEKNERRTVQKELITTEEHEELKTKTTITGSNYRGISDEVLKFYGCRTEYQNGEVYARYYPYTIEGTLAGYKCRVHPKTFGGNIGNTGKECDMYGQFRFEVGGKYLLALEGEEDAHAAYQMFLEYSRSKESDFVTAVVSLGQGVSSAKQVANNYEFFNKFEYIYLGMDADEAGTDGIEKIVAALPKGKVKIVKWDKKLKDPNNYLLAGQQKKFIQDFYKAEMHVPVGVMGSNHLYEQILSATGQKKLAFPPLMKELNTMLAGGLPLGHVVNLAAATSIGKTTLINELVYFWIFNSPHLIGIVSMEADAAQYGESLLSRHISKKIALIENEEIKDTFLRSDATAKAAKQLFETADGNPRFYLLDDRDGTVEQLQEVIEQMVISSGCRIIVIDPIQDIFAGLSNEDQERFMKWTKSMVKSHNCTFILINHVRKSQSGEKDAADGARLSESDIHGSSSLIKSSSVNILLSRNKMAEDENERNTTLVDCTKNRVCGITGNAGALYYDNATHTLHNYEDYFGIKFIPKTKK